jgi:hypothetical protein
MCKAEYNELVAREVSGTKSLLQRCHSLVVTMVVTVTGVGTGPGKISNRAPNKQEKVHSFENQARMGEKMY